MSSEDRSLYVGVNLHDCLWPHMQKCKGTFLMHWVPIGPGCLSPKAPLVWVTTQIHRIEKSRRLRSMEGYAGLLMPRTNGMTKTLTYRALEQGRCQGHGAVLQEDAGLDMCCRTTFQHTCLIFTNIHCVPRGMQAGRSSQSLLQSSNDQN